VLKGLVSRPGGYPGLKAGVECMEILWCVPLEVGVSTEYSRTRSMTVVKRQRGDEADGDRLRCTLDDAMGTGPSRLSTCLLQSKVEYTCTPRRASQWAGQRRGQTQALTA
jgi:hypothetical protein